MSRKTMIAVFGSREGADAAREVLLEAGFGASDVTVSIDFSRDAIAAEAPGQAFENQATTHNAGVDAWVGSSFRTIVDNDTAVAKRIADIQRGAAVLTLAGRTSELEHAVELVQPFHPLALRRIT